MIVLGGKAKTTAEAERLLKKTISSGAAAETMRKLIAAHHGDPRVVDEPDRLPTAAVIHDVTADRAGWVTSVDPLELGLSAITLGAGRTRADQSISPEVGIVLTARRGVKVKKGVVLARVHAKTKAAAKAVEARVRASFTIADTVFPAPPLIIGRIEA